MIHVVVGPEKCKVVGVEKRARGGREDATEVKVTGLSSACVFPLLVGRAKSLARRELRHSEVSM